MSELNTSESLLKRLLSNTEGFFLELRVPSNEYFQERREHLKKALLFSLIFFSLYYLGVIIPEYGLNDPQFFVDFMAGNCILVSFLISCVFTRKYKSEALLALPAYGAMAASLIMLNHSEFFFHNKFTWNSALIIGIIFARTFGSLRNLVIIVGLSLTVPLLSASFNESLNFLHLLHTQAIVYFLSPFLIYSSYVSICQRKAQELSYKDADLVRFASDLGTWKLNLSNNSAEYDERWSNILGYKKSELEGTLETWEKLTHPYDIEAAKTAFEDYLSGKSPKYEVKVRMAHKNGYWVTVLSKGKVTQFNPEGAPLIFSGTHFDFSAFEKIEIENKDLQELAMSIQEMANVGAWELNVSSGETTWTEQIYRIHELPVGTPTDLIDGLNYYAEHDRDRIAKCVSECIRNGTAFDGEFELITEKGNKIWVRSQGHPIRNSRNKIEKVKGTFQDITTKKNLEKTLEEEEIKLFQSSKLATLGEMAAGVAHEINNPLAIISSSSKVMQKNIENPEKLEKLGETLDKSVERISKIISGLKKFSQQSTKIEYNKFSGIEFLKESIQLTKATAQRYNVNLRLLDDSENVVIISDELQVQQVVINLIKNAIDANTGSENPWVEVSLKSNDDFIQIIVRDSGKGIDKETRNKLFNPFFTTKDQGKGTGLGLSISKGIAQNHYGDLEYHLINGHTAFVLTLPHIKDIIKAA